MEPAIRTATHADLPAVLGAIRLTAIVADDERAAGALWEAVGYERQAARSRFVRVLDGSAG